MRLLVDCYNVLRADLPPQMGRTDEAGLCRAVARSRWAQVGVRIVADGVVKPMGARVSPVPGVELVYSGPGRSADAVIIEAVRRHPQPRRLTVVSSDREIRDAARRRRARDLPSDTFLQQLDRDLRHGVRRTGRPTAKRADAGPLGPEEVADWLDAFGVAGPPAPAAGRAAEPVRPDATAAATLFGSVTVRPGRAADADAAHRLAPDTAAAGWRAELAGGRVRVADAGGEVVGLLRHVELWPGVCFLSQISVAPEHRRRGHGRTLLGSLRAELRAAGVGQLLSSAPADAAGAVAWHRRCGFGRHGRIDRLPGRSAADVLFRLAP